MPTPLQISVLIPVRDYDCSALVKALHAEMQSSHISGEIILGDDCSEASYAQLYQRMQDEQFVRLYRAESNMGAGRMRNHLATLAYGTQLLLIDSDTMPVSSTFVADYLVAATPDSVVVGGFTYPNEPPSRDKLLRYKYGWQVEMRPLAERRRAPWQAFISMCFLIPRALFLEEGFAPEMGMGYEDAYFGYRLHQRGIPIMHIDNPVLHALKETSAQFLQTTERYVANLYCHRELLAPCPIHLLQSYRRIRRAGLLPLLRLVAPILQLVLRRQLTSRHPSLRLFSLYKLLHFVRCR